MSITRVFEDIDEGLYYLVVSNDKYKDLFASDFTAKVGFNRDALKELHNLLSNMVEYDIGIDEILVGIEAFQFRKEHPRVVR